MEQDLFANLPSEMIMNILTKLPVGSIIRCKCVCKAWFDLIKTDEFVRWHLCTSPPRLAAFNWRYRVFRFEDGLDLRFSSCSTDQFRIGGSVDGLLFIIDLSNKRASVLNPITRQKISLYDFSSFGLTYCGFGKSKMTGKYKLVRIRHCRSHYDQDTSMSFCYVYTLGTGLERLVKGDAPVYFSHNDIGAFLNGNLHWLVRNKEGTHWISCFDLENEVFTTLSPPPLLSARGYARRRVDVLGGCLCLSDAIPEGGEFVIWLMKEYGVEKSWAKEFVIRRNHFGLQFIDFYTIRVSKDGDMLVFGINSDIYSFSKKNNTVERCDLCGWNDVYDSFVYTPSFLSLTRFENEFVFSVHPEYMYHIY